MLDLGHQGGAVIPQQGQQATRFISNQRICRVIVTGSRDWRRPSSVRNALNALLGYHGSILLTHGLCPTGADDDAETWFQENVAPNVRRKVFPANWKLHGSRAGFIRNEVMILSGADLVLAFANPCPARKPWCPPGLHPSHGTADCVKQARQAGIQVKFSPEGMSW
jgi:hypothetical protein